VTALFSERRARGTLLGLAVGDALGAPLELSAPEDARSAVERGLEMTGGGSWEPGEWTDDTALALCLAESILARGLLDTDDLASRYIAWANETPKGIGRTTRAALKGARDAAHARLQTREHHARTGFTAGNGTVMRAAPIALAANSVEEASSAARADALLTHHDPAAAACSAALCAALIALRVGNDPLAAANHEVQGDKRIERMLETVRTFDVQALAAAARGRERGACWTTLGVALYALEAFESYERGVLWAISLGGDTDTNAAVAGALIGCRDGEESIPERWVSVLRGKERIYKAAVGLCHAGPSEHDAHADS
jgi:ADP-ribosyl-[dinitrogen reductase] hydrolase